MESRASSNVHFVHGRLKQPMGQLRGEDGSAAKVLVRDSNPSAVAAAADVRIKWRRVRGEWGMEGGTRRHSRRVAAGAATPNAPRSRRLPSLPLRIAETLRRPKNILNTREGR